MLRREAETHHRDPTIVFTDGTGSDIMLNYGWPLREHSLHVLPHPSPPSHVKGESLMFLFSLKWQFFISFRTNGSFSCHQNSDPGLISWLVNYGWTYHSFLSWDETENCGLTQMVNRRVSSHKLNYRLVLHILEGGGRMKEIEIAAIVAYSESLEMYGQEVL